MYETIRIVGKIRPKFILWENVKNILSQKHKHNFERYIETLDALGYNSYYQVLNAKDFGIPQNRERVYTVSIRKDVDKGTFKFPKKEELRLRLKDVLEEKVDAESLEAKTICLNSKGGRNGIEGLQPSLKDRIYDTRGISACIATSNFFMPKYLVNGNIRSLSAKECWRLMGFDDGDFEKAKATGNSNSQLYKQAGNSIVVNVLEKIFKELFKEVEK